VVTIAKRALPLVALLLLAVVIVWPEMHRGQRLAVVKSNPVVADPASGTMSNGRFNGLNENGEPFTITAATALQVGQSRIDLGAPVGDMSLKGGSWLQAKGHHGVYDQLSGQLDLAEDVMLYRDDGTTMTTDSATIDTKQGAAISADRVHVEGPFGTLDAQGFSLVDRGGVLQFTGPGRLLLRGAGE
jgi:lipopolysaccharide export system protein LptC